MKNSLVTLLWLAVVATLFGPPCVKGAMEAEEVWPTTATPVPEDTPLQILFNEPPTLGKSGRIVVRQVADDAEVASVDLADSAPVNEYAGRILRYQPILVDGNLVTIRLHTHALQGDAAYYILIEPGVFRDGGRRDWAGIDDNSRWRFQTKRATAAPPDQIVVAADGSGDFCTVQGAVDTVPTGRETPTRIFIRRGVYDGFVRIPIGKDHLRFEGEDRQGVRLCGTNNERLNPGSSFRPVIRVAADDFVLENLAVQNTTPYGGSQAEALQVRGGRAVLRHADFYSFQDTLHFDGQVYVEDCNVEGDVDFIWGTGSAFFKKCTLRALHTGFFVQARNPPGKPGFIFDRCRLTTASEADPIWLARVDADRFPASEVVFLRCKMDDRIRREGWMVTGNPTDELDFAEFGSMDLQGNPLNVTRRLAASRQLDQGESTALGSPVAVVGGGNGWDPRAPLVPAPVRVFDVTDYGAKGDGVNPDTAAVQAAIEATQVLGGGVVKIPAGNYLISPIFLRSHVTLQLDPGATLRGTDNPPDYGADPNNPDAKLVALVNGTDLVDVAITGQGAIDGQGKRWWKAFENVQDTGLTPATRPRLVRFNGCRGVTVKGVTLTNSPSFHLVPTDCENVVIQSLTITAPADSPNTDGIDPSTSRNVTISDCLIDTGDDNIALKSGHVDPAHPGAACANVVITNCTFLHGHGVSIGSETLGGVSDVLVQNCTFRDTTNGFRIKSSRGRGGLVQNIRVSDIQMTNVDPAITITGYYPTIPDKDKAQPVTAETPVYRGIELVNIRATCPREAGVIIGLPESPITDFSMENVHVSAKSGFTFRNVTSPNLNDVQVFPVGTTP